MQHTLSRASAHADDTPLMFIFISYCMSIQVVNNGTSKERGRRLIHSKRGEQVANSRKEREL